MDQINKEGISDQKKKKKKEKKNYHRILHIPINLGSKIQLQETSLIFGTNFQKKCYFWLKTEKININNEFFIFELAWLFPV